MSQNPSPAEAARERTCQHEHRERRYGIDRCLDCGSEEQSLPARAPRPPSDAGLMRLPGERPQETVARHRAESDARGMEAVETEAWATHLSWPMTDEQRLQGHAP